MKKFLALAFAALILSSCGDERPYSERKAEMENKLPPNCEFLDLGGITNERNSAYIYVMAVNCKATDVTTTSSTWQSGKTRSNATTIIFGGQEIDSVQTKTILPRFNKDSKEQMLNNKFTVN